MMLNALLFALALHAPVTAATLAGVTLPDTAAVGGQTLALNGLGLREKFYIDVYVGGLYLQHPTHDGGAAAAANEPKRIVMHFVYKVTKEQMSDSFKEGFAASPGATAEQIQQVFAAMPEIISPGQEVVIDYVPGVGTTFVIAGQKRATLPGEAFMKALFGVYLGPKPPTADLKRGLLGG
jgi:hypothetical protein